LDEQAVTTSEGQGYAMLRAVWSNDRKTFEEVWRWTERNLQVRNDKLFAWKWKAKVLSLDTATDADTDIALALILASRRFDHPLFEQEALAILYSIWNLEILHLDDRSYVTAGNWAIYEDYPTIHVAYLAPYAYEVFASIDSQHDWRRVIDGSYALLHWLYDDEHVVLPPDLVYLDKNIGRFVMTHPRTGKTAGFSYDAFPIFWRVALDAQWFGRSEAELRGKMLGFFWSEWQARSKFVDRYSLSGEPRSSIEALPLYATVHSLAWRDHPELARRLAEMKLPPLHANAIAGKDTPYYLHNWLWFARATELQQVRRYDEYFAFLRPFDFVGFSAHFPWELCASTLLLFLVAQWHWVLKLSFLACGVGLCVRYLDWRLNETINWVEPGGPFISLSLWLAEFYAFSTVVLLLVQVGLGRRGEPRNPPALPAGFLPSVDLLIPIYSEPCDILEKTLLGAGAITYANKRVYVLDDSHRVEVQALAEGYGATYIKGPKRHAKAGNLNHALAQTDGELVVVFDTDHIPVSTFLSETVPFFADPRMGFADPASLYNQGYIPAGARHRCPYSQRAGPVQSCDSRSTPPVGWRVFCRQRSGVPTIGRHGSQRVQSHEHYGRHSHQPTPPCQGLAVRVCGQRSGGRAGSGKPLLVYCAATPVDVGMFAGLLQGQSAPVSRVATTASTGLFRLAVLFLVPPGPSGLLDHTTVLSDLSSAPDLF
jgi:cellulose synthase (UDP-forming)